MNLRRLLAALLLATTGLFVLAGPASAHADLKSSTPAEGAVLAAAPTQIELTFSEPVTLPPDPVKVVGRDGTAWRVGSASISGPRVTVPVTPAGPAGAYTVTYDVIAADGDNMNGTVHFTLTAPAAGAPAPNGGAPSPTPAPIPGQASSAAQSQPAATSQPAGAPQSSLPASATSGAPAASTSPAVADAATESSGLPVWVWIVGAIVVVFAAVVAGLRLVKSRRPE